MKDNEYDGDGNPFQETNPSIKEFINQFKEYSDECSIDGITVNSHPSIPTRVGVYCINSDNFYDLVGISIDRLGGCSCAAGICLEIKQEIEHPSEHSLWRQFTKDLSDLHIRPYHVMSDPVSRDMTKMLFNVWKKAKGIKEK